MAYTTTTTTTTTTAACAVTISSGNPGPNMATRRRRQRRRDPRTTNSFRSGATPLLLLFFSVLLVDLLGTNNPIRIYNLPTLQLGTVHAWSSTTTTWLPRRRTRQDKPSSTTSTAGTGPLWATSTSDSSSSSSSSTERTTTPLPSPTTTTTPAASPTVALSYTEWTTTATNTNNTDNQNHNKAQPPPVLFLHGLLGNKKNFASLARGLGQQLQTPRRIFGVDLRHHGASCSIVDKDDQYPPNSSSMAYPDLAADVVLLLDRLQLKQVVLVGHSMGGKVAQAMALLHPHRVQGLVVLDMAPVTYTEEHDATWETVCRIVRTLVQAGNNRDLTSPSPPNHSHDASPRTKRQMDAALRKDIPDAALRAFCLTNWDDATGQWKIPLATIANQLSTLAAFDVYPPENWNDSNPKDALVYGGDAFFIHGGQSRFVRHTHLPQIQQYFPNHMLTTIRGSGHWVHAEAPEDTLSLLLQFLDR